MKLEEYILKRKTEDGINEFDRDKRAENTRICVNYVLSILITILKQQPEKKERYYMMKK